MLYDNLYSVSCKHIYHELHTHMHKKIKEYRPYSTWFEVIFYKKVEKRCSRTKHPSATRLLIP